MKLQFRYDLRKLVNLYGVDTELGQSDAIIERSINDYLETLKLFAHPDGKNKKSMDNSTVRG